MTDISPDDKLFYYAALEYVSEVIETSRSFLKFNSRTTMTGEVLSEDLIRSVKRWLLSEPGASWLGSLGYYTNTTITGSVGMVAGCSICGSQFNKLTGSRCESCGSLVCSSCSLVVDNYYGIEWCSECGKRLGR